MPVIARSACAGIVNGASDTGGWGARFVFNPPSCTTGAGILRDAGSAFKYRGGSASKRALQPGAQK